MEYFRKSSILVALLFLLSNCSQNSDKNVYMKITDVSYFGYLDTTTNTFVENTPFFVYFESILFNGTDEEMNVKFQTILNDTTDNLSMVFVSGRDRIVVYRDINTKGKVKPKDSLYMHFEMS
jgi:PBP1b-binding outer membrane lipoprotein LpoB